MKFDIAKYRGQYLKFTILPENGVIFNTIDVCRILHITTRPANGILNEACLNIKDIVETVLEQEADHQDFVEWLNEKFADYNQTTLIVSHCDPNWSV